MQSKIKLLFESTKGNRVFSTIENTIIEHNMSEDLKNGVLVGFSGGADSVFLLSFLMEYSDRYGAFKIQPVHINHGIRGDEALRDENFSKEFCNAIGLTCIVEYIDVPSLAKSTKRGIEESARYARYSAFRNIIQGRNDINCIVTAHNATDNAETVIFNMLRGAGTRGASGISPKRENIIRPLIDVSKDDIRCLLEEFKIPYVVDSTNISDDYTRNFIRKNVFPQFRKVVPDPEKSLSRLSRNLRSDDDYLQTIADDFIGDHAFINSSKLAKLHPSIFYRVMLKMIEPYSVSISEKQANTVRALLQNGDFRFSLSGGISFVSERGISYIINTDEYFNIDYKYPILVGENSIDEFSAIIYLNNTHFDKIFPFVHKKSIQVDISSAIIEGELFIRPRKDGDTVFYNGMTHKLKKLYNDRKIPISIRPLIPVLCDEKGVVWVPGFGVRSDLDGEGCKKKPLYLTLVIDDDAPIRKRFHTGEEFRL